MAAAELPGGALRTFSATDEKPRLKNGDRSWWPREVFWAIQFAQFCA
jgi:hypothetical protein